jgi:hypothetical protein
LFGSSAQSKIVFIEGTTRLERRTLPEVAAAIRDNDLDPRSYKVEIIAPRNGTAMHAKIWWWAKDAYGSDFDVDIVGTNKIQVDGVAHLVENLLAKINAEQPQAGTGFVTSSKKVAFQVAQFAPETPPAAPQHVSTEKKAWWKGPLGWAAGIVGALIVAYVTYLLGWN